MTRFVVRAPSGLGCLYIACDGRAYEQPERAQKFVFPKTAAEIAKRLELRGGAGWEVVARVRAGRA